MIRPVKVTIGCSKVTNRPMKVTIHILKVTNAHLIAAGFD